jgi:hypothetical protein
MGGIRGLGAGEQGRQPKGRLILGRRVGFPIVIPGAIMRSPNIQPHQVPAAAPAASSSIQFHERSILMALWAPVGAVVGTVVEGGHAQDTRSQSPVVACASLGEAALTRYRWQRRPSTRISSASHGVRSHRAPCRKIHILFFCGRVARRERKGGEWENNLTAYSGPLPSNSMRSLARSLSLERKPLLRLLQGQRRARSITDCPP